MKEKLMASAERSLHLVVERWLAPEFAKQVRVTRFRNRRSVRECYVCVETFNATGAVAMFFFRHEDGTWRIFPPRRERPMMRAA
jgi:hypothetical protein